MSCFKDHASLGYFYTNPDPDPNSQRYIGSRRSRGAINNIDQTQALVSFTKRSTAQISKRTGKPIMDEIKKKLS